MQILFIDIVNKKWKKKEKKYCENKPTISITLKFEKVSFNQRKGCKNRKPEIVILVSLLLLVCSLWTMLQPLIMQ